MFKPGRMCPDGPTRLFLNNNNNKNLQLTQLVFFFLIIIIKEWITGCPSVFWKKIANNM